MADEATKEKLPEKTLKLAQGKNPPTFAEPGGKDVAINIGMELSIFVPSLNVQRAGFTPYRFEDGKRVDATNELLTQYPGTYKPIISK